MKRYIALFSAIIGFLVFGRATAGANEALHDMIVTIPFEFTVGDTTLPRDTYRVSRASGHSDALLLNSLRRSVFMIGQQDRSGSKDEPTAFVFHRYGDRYFLRELRYLGGVGFELPRARAEREAAERIARSSPDREIVVITARAR